MNYDIRKSLESIENSIRSANNCFIDGIHHYEADDEYLEICEYYLDKAFIELLLVLEKIGHLKTYEKLNKFYEKVKKNNTITNSKVGEDDPYLVNSEILRIYIASIINIENLDLNTGKVPNHIAEIIRQSIYPMNNKEVWAESPSNENDVHVRVEAILKCIYHDLISKPPISKQIKSFIPDTGIPSEKLLIEYKFISTKQQAKTVADEILADTRGYISKEWNKLLFVIYETKRVKSESDWKQLIKQCELSENTEIIVISGEAKKLKAKST